VNLKKQKINTAFCMSVMFLIAISCTIIGTLLPFIIIDFNITLSQAGIVTMAQNFGGVAALAISGILLDRFGKRMVTFSIFAMMTAALLSGFWIQSFGAFVLATMVIGLSASSLNMCVSVYLADLYPLRGNFFINMGGVFFGFGSMAAPLYINMMTSMQKGWRLDFGFLGVLCAVVLAAFLFGSLGVGKEKTKQKEGETICLREVFRQPGLPVLALIGFLFMAHSSAFMGWIPTYLSEHFAGQDEINNLIMTAYWAGILLGRILCTVFAGKMDQKMYIILGSGLGGVGMALSILVSGPALMAVYSFVGIVTGAIFQVCLAMVCRMCSRLSGTASSLVALSASIGAFL
jgi:fucose permease